MAHVNEGSHSFTCHPNVHPQMEWAMPVFTPNRRVSPHFGWYSFSVQLRVGSWVGWGGWLHTEVQPANFCPSSISYLGHCISGLLCALLVDLLLCPWLVLKQNQLYSSLLCFHAYVMFLLWPPCVADADIIFLPCGLFFFSLSNLSRRRLHVYHTSTHGVALVQI